MKTQQKLCFNDQKKLAEGTRHVLTKEQYFFLHLMLLHDFIVKTPAVGQQ